VSAPPPCLLIYDGACNICRYWVGYWRQRTGDRADYRPYQDAAQDYPELPVAAFRRSIQLFLPDGRRCEGAEAAYRILALAPGHGHWLRLYLRLPGFAAISEFGYRFLSRRRRLLSGISRLLWGRRPPPPSRYELSCALLLRGLGAVYAIAFFSLWVQIEGLVGSRGILPISDYLELAREALGSSAYWRIPTLFWLHSGDLALHAVCLAGCFLAVRILLGKGGRLAAALAFVLYLSLCHAGQAFLRFQWDLLLLEAGFLAIFLSPGSALSLWLYRWLLFRFVFLSGAVKLLSGDPSWAALTALQYHYETQPLPTPLAWYAHHLPDAWHQFSAAVVLGIELAAVFLIFLPRQARFLAGAAILLLELCILLTGNYNFFNLLTMLLCLSLYDDAALRSVLPAGRRPGIAASPPPRAAIRWATATLAATVVTINASQFWRLFAAQELPGAAAAERFLRPLRIVNPYGVFAVMTRQRLELVLEGSRDRRSWHEYSLRYKPGPTARGLPWVFPHQPRLDWQCWFAVLGTAREHPWVGNLVYRLLRNSPPVLALFDHNPFPDNPPRYVRALLYRYSYAAPDERRRDNALWRRELLGYYLPATQLQGAP